MTFDTPRPHGPNTNFLKMPIQEFMQKIREKSLKSKSDPPPNPLYGNVDIPLYKSEMLYSRNGRLELETHEQFL